MSRCKRIVTLRVKVEPGLPPEGRVRKGLIFDVVGVDLAVLSISLMDPKLRESYKCALYRAIYLDLLPSLSVEIFPKVLRRFIATIGRLCDY